jgi:ubiquinone/menaquinone biosynthesis C-methylase UbiE
MKIWGNIFALGYDRLMAATENAGLRTYRENLLQAASGRVLEIGGGTGANLPFYGEGVTELMVAEPEPPMMRQLRRKLDGYRIPTTILSAPAEQLPVPAETFDCVVSTLVLCTVPDPARALAEVRRVLKARGQLLFIEHAIRRFRACSVARPPATALGVVWTRLPVQPEHRRDHSLGRFLDI